MSSHPIPYIGCARVSTLDQDLDLQVTRLKAEGCSIIRSETVSGGSRDGRTELATILEFLRHGDERVVTRLDRLGRDTRDMLHIIHDAEQWGGVVTALDSHVSARGEMGHVLLTLLGMVARMEHRFIKEPQREGIAPAKDEGIHTDGKRRIDRAQIKAKKAAGRGPTTNAAELG